MKITLYLMTKKGLEVLRALVDERLEAFISKVIVGKDASVENDFSSEIISVCNDNNVRCGVRGESACETSDYSIAVSWKWLISDDNSRLIVLHDSLLPKYRGFSPLVNMLCNREELIGVTAIFASGEYDRGDIISQSSTVISYPIKISRAIDLISRIYVELVLEIFSTLGDGAELVATKQDEELASYSLWRGEDDYLIDWEDDSKNILNLINAVSSPYMGAVAHIDGGQKVRILDAELQTDVKIENRDAGKVIFLRGELPVIVCGSGLIKLLKMVDDATREDLLPLKRYRIKLTSSP